MKTPYSMTRPTDQLAVPLLAWFDAVHANRDMPWRHTRDPYAIWLSEIMLQQTQVKTVKRFYTHFLKRFPTISELAAAPLEAVLSHWAGLGYYRRAKHLHQAAKLVAQNHDGALPATAEALRELPGIGRYTAGAIASIAFGRPSPVVDGNIMRVLSRLTGYDRDIAQPANHEFFWTQAQAVVSAAPDRRFGDVNQAMMELGATVCAAAPAAPSCLLCPVKEYCRAHASGRQMELPVKSKRSAIPVLRWLAIVLLKNNRALMMRRGQGGIWEGMWEFPMLPRTGKISPAKFLRQKTGWTVKGMQPCGPVVHVLTHRRMEYDVVHADAQKLNEDVPLLPGYVEAKWVEWPPKKGGVLPMAAVVHRIAAAVQSAAGRSAAQ